jgi:uncharacterized protein (DUF433 family)
MSQYGPSLIVVDPEICGGKPVVKGTRVPVEQLIRLARKGYSEERIAEEFDLSENLVKKVIKAVQRTPSVKFA